MKRDHSLLDRLHQSPSAQARVLAELLAPPSAEVATPRKTLATVHAFAPADPRAFASVGGDHNPIHASPVAARLAGLPQPIVHGMWTAARLHQLAGGGPQARPPELLFLVRLQRVVGFGGQGPSGHLEGFLAAGLEAVKGGG